MDKKKKSFWVRNDPRTEYPVEVKPAPFYPDFLAFINAKWIVVDVKGKHLAEAKQIDDRKKALKLLEKEGGVQTFFLVDKVMEKEDLNRLKLAAWTISVVLTNYATRNWELRSLRTDRSQRYLIKNNRFLCLTNFKL